MPQPLIAAFWGLVAGSALVVGAAIGFFAKVRPRIVAAVMAFGAGVLISALSFDLMDEAYRGGGFPATACGFMGGAAAFTVVNMVLARRGAKHRKRSQVETSEEDNPGSGLSIAAGALLDGIPESIVIGVSLLGGKSVSMVAVVAVFLSNVPEGWSSAAGMRKSGRPASYVFGVWTAIAVVSAIAALLGNLAFRHSGAGIVAATTATAAGAILAMLAETMIPEAFAEAHDLTGLITAVGFLAAFALSRIL
jgi:ZIP family zinc transporter